MSSECSTLYMRRITSFLTLFLLTNCASGVELPGLDAESIDFRSFNCDDQFAQAQQLGFNTSQAVAIKACCTELGGACNCVSEFINTSEFCIDDSGCNGGTTCVDGFCVPANECELPAGGGDGSECAPSCVENGVDVLCPSHLTCWDSISDSCLPCNVCDQCDPGCDLTSAGLACPTGDAAPLYTCAQIVALRYLEDKPNQWVAVRNMCAETNSVASWLRGGTNGGWGTVFINGEIPVMKPGGCTVIRNPNPALLDPEQTLVAEGVGVVTAIAARKEGIIPRDYVLYGDAPNTKATPGWWGVIDAFGFGGSHDYETHAFRNSTKILGNHSSHEPPADCD